MKFTQKLIQGTFLKRYKRFFADVQLHDEDGKPVVVAHCANTGSMRSCLVEGSECWISVSDNPKRKLRYSLEAVTAEHGGMAGINTARANKLVKEALESGNIEELSEYEQIASEVRYGKHNSRLDFCLSSGDERCYVEVKNLTYSLPNRMGVFPDAVTERGRKHLHELIHAVQQGHRALLFFCVQHTDIRKVRPAWETDSAYAETLVQAIDQGVEVVAYNVTMSPVEFRLDRRLPFSVDS